VRGLPPFALTLSLPKGCPEPCRRIEGFFTLFPDPEPSFHPFALSLSKRSSPGHPVLNLVEGSKGAGSVRRLEGSHHLHESASVTFKRRPVSKRGMKNLIPTERIERFIFLIRGQKILLDADLAVIYGVATKVLNQGVKRNMRRFPSDFVFRLTAEELEATQSQIVTGSQKDRDPRFLPYAFTEHGAIMAANVLNSRRAVLIASLSHKW
jgi:hypothetical protein